MSVYVFIEPNERLAHHIFLNLRFVVTIHRTFHGRGQDPKLSRYQMTKLQVKNGQ